MVLSRFYSGKEKDGMPKGFGHCQQVASKNPVRLNLVQKGEYSFPKGSPLRYVLQQNNNYISKVNSTSQLNNAKYTFYLTDTNGFFFKFSVFF
jgi:hypothetical protein